MSEPIVSPPAPAPGVAGTPLPPAVLPPATSRPRQVGPYGLVMLVGIAAVLVAAALDLLLGRPVSTTTASAATGVIAVATLLAIGIERLLQVFWTLMDQVAANPSTPFSGEAQRLENLANQLGAIARPVLQQALDTLRAVDAAALKAPTTVAAVEQQINALLMAVDSATGQAPNPAGGLATFRAGLQALQAVFAAPTTLASLAAASEAVDDLTALVNGVADDPGRRVLSLFAGAILGLFAAGLLSLDVVHAAMGAPAPTESLNGHTLPAWLTAGPAAWPWGMVVTGLVVGLGSNPLHELIQAIQVFKQQTKNTLP